MALPIIAATPQIEELVRSRKQRALLAAAAGASPGAAAALPPGSPAPAVQRSGDSTTSTGSLDIIRNAAEACSTSAQVSRAVDDMTASLPALTLSEQESMGALDEEEGRSPRTAALAAGPAAGARRPLASPTCSDAASGGGTSVTVEQQQPFRR